MTDDTQSRVLIVEDERKIADGYAAALDAAFDVSTAYSGEAALEVVDDETDVVLLDRRMPGLSGEEVLDEIRDLGLDCPVAMVTAVVPDFDVVDMGFDDYLVKPVDIDELHDLVRRLEVLGEMDPEVRDYVAESVKQASLESGKADVELERNENYQRLRESVVETSAQLGDVSARMSDEEFEMVLETITRNLRTGAGSDD